MANHNFTQKMFTLRNYPVILDFQFTVTPTNASGITSLSGPGIANVFMHTSTTPTTGSPNPEAGTAMILLQGNYRRLLGASCVFTSPSSGVDLSSGLTAGRAYTISVLGTTTAAQWLTAGLPAGLTAAVGMTFIAAATSFSGTGKVQVPLSSLTANMEFLGDPNLTLKNSTYPSAGLGPYVLVRFMAPQALSFSAATHTSTTVDTIAAATVQKLQVGMRISGAGIPVGATIASIASATSITISAAATASATITAVAEPVDDMIQPATGSVCRMQLYLSNSSILQYGES